MRKNLAIAAALALAASSGPSFFGGGPYASVAPGAVGSKKRTTSNRDKMAKASRRKNRGKK